MAGALVALPDSFRRKELAMPRPDLTDITIVLDRSGSMETVKGATIDAFNQFLRSQRAAAGSARISLVQFDNEYEVLYEAEWLDQADELNNDRFVPRGSTALLDAMGRTIIKTGERLAAMPESERPGTVLFVTLTDGHENASRKYDSHRVNAMITQQRDAYQWQFVFLAANQDAIATAARMGIGPKQALSFEASAEGVCESFVAVDRRVSELRRRRAAGDSDSRVEFDDTDRDQARR